jgi:hypothetical protein
MLRMALGDRFNYSERQGQFALSSADGVTPSLGGSLRIDTTPSLERVINSLCSTQF